MDGILASAEATFLVSALRRAERTSVNHHIQACISNKLRETTLTFLNFRVLGAGKTALVYVFLVYRVYHLTNKI